MSEEPVLIVIPARGGSKGVPRKNLRRLGGRPLIAHAIEVALASRHRPVIAVTSDDDEILSVAASLGAEPIRRRHELATDEATLDVVIHDAYVTACQQSGHDFEVVATVQPTSPLVRAQTLDAAIHRLLTDESLDTVISAAPDTHLRWVERDGRFEPAFEKRLNRQYLPQEFRETGGFLVTRSRFVTPTSRIGPHVTLEVVTRPEAIDIDTVDDFLLAEWYLSRRRIVFVVAGTPEIGLGHVQNSLTIAAELIRHEIDFVVPRGHQLAAAAIRSHHYPVHEQSTDDLARDVLDLDPTLVVNDVLDTDAAYVEALKGAGVTVANFEDLGEGAQRADLVINAIYPERRFLPGHYFGHRYFIARNEFLVAPPMPVRDDVSRVLVTFGGTDPGNLTAKVVGAIAPFCRDRGIAVDVVIGSGYQHRPPKAGHGVEVLRDVRNISDYMRSADVVFTSAGRTVFEVALVGTPAIILAQNDREMTHLFASEANGFLHLGLGRDCEPDTILSAFADLVANPASRRAMHDLMLEHEIRGGRERVVELLETAIMRA